MEKMARYVFACRRGFGPSPDSSSPKWETSVCGTFSSRLAEPAPDSEDLRALPGDPGVAILHVLCSHCRLVWRRRKGRNGEKWYVGCVNKEKLKMAAASQDKTQRLEPNPRRASTQTSSHRRKLSPKHAELPHHTEPLRTSWAHLGTWPGINPPLPRESQAFPSGRGAWGSSPKYPGPWSL